MLTPEAVTMCQGFWPFIGSGLACVFHPLRPRWIGVGLQLASGTASGEGRAVSQGSVADTGIAVVSRKQYVGHAVLRKWLEEQGVRLQE